MHRLSVRFVLYIAASILTLTWRGPAVETATPAFTPSTSALPSPDRTRTARPSPVVEGSARAQLDAGVLDRAARTRALEAIDAMPLRFEVNAGQADADVRFLARGAGYGVGLTSRGAVLSLTARRGPASTEFDAAVLGLALIGAAPHPRLAGTRPAGGPDQLLPRQRPVEVADRRPDVCARALRAGVPGHRPGLLRQPGRAAVRLPRRAGRRSDDDPLRRRGRRHGRARRRGEPPDRCRRPHRAAAPAAHVSGRRRRVAARSRAASCSTARPCVSRSASTTRAASSSSIPR